MLENFLFSVNAVFPLFILVLIGYTLKRIKFLDASFFAQSERFVFKLALPSMLFLEITSAGGGAEIYNAKFIAFCSVSVVVLSVLLCLIIPCLVKGNDKRGAIIQGIFRSNFAVLGVSLAGNMFGERGVQTIAIVLPFIVVIFNVLAVIVLSIFAPHDSKMSFGQLLKKIFFTVVSNPLIISVAVALVFLGSGLHLPTAVEKSVSYLSNTTFALALMSLGANVTAESLRGKLRYALAATVTKTIVVPAIMLFVAYVLGFREIELCAVFILYGTPSAISSYIMAKNMKSDYELAGQILLLTTLFSLFTIFLGVFLLKTMGLI
ncbi:MAG: AEC family transporter [Clostridia bacterium]|nr:AEC family transporter [Clostridia bacterium]